MYENALKLQNNLLKHAIHILPYLHSVHFLSIYLASLVNTLSYNHSYWLKK